MPKFSTIIETIIISILFVGAIVVPFIAIIGKNMMTSSSSLSSSLSLQQQQQQRNIEIVYFTVGVSAIAGLAFYLYNKNKQKDNDRNEKTTTVIDRKNKSTESTSTRSTTQQIKDIWKAGSNNNNKNSSQNNNSNSNNNNNRTTTKNKKRGYKEKPFGSKYYYAHNDSNTTGGYKDGLKMEDYRMNGPRLLSRNGLSVQDETSTATIDDDDDDDDDENKEKEMTYDCDNSKNNNNAGGEDDDVQDNNNSGVKNVTNITKYLWDDPGDSKGIGTIRIDVLPSSSSLSSSPSYVNVKDVKIENVNASLMEGGRGLLVNIDSGCSCRYQLKINKLYENASDVKVITKPKRLLIKIYKKKTKNYNDLAAWPQPHKKI
jgi:hypothetical protein